MLRLDKSKIIKIVVVFAAYFLTAKYGLALGAVSGFASLVWAPTGIAIAAILIWGYEMSVGIALAAFCVNFFILNGPLPAAFGIMIGNTLEAVLAVFLLKKIGFDNTLKRSKDVLGLILIAALFATAISATIGVTSLLLAGIVKEEFYFVTWFPWWVGDMLGVLIITPLILIFSRKQSFVSNQFFKFEFLALVIFLIAVDLLVFTNIFIQTSNRPLAYLLILPIIWAAARFKEQGGAIAMFVTAGIAIWGTANNIGPFVGQDINSNLLQLQIFMFCVSAASLILASSMRELETAKNNYVRASENLEEKVKERTISLNDAQRLSNIGSWEWDIPNNIITWSDELCRIYGVNPDGFKPNYDDFIKYLHPDDRDMVDKIVKNSFETKKPFEFFHRIMRPDGTTRTLNARGRVEADDKGNAIKMFGTGQDVTESKEIQKELALRNNELEKVNKLMIDREIRMIELKKEMNKMEASLKELSNNK